MLNSVALCGSCCYRDITSVARRNPIIFGAILEYYRTGILSKPPTVSDSQFFAELEYFNVPLDGGRSRVFIWGRGASYSILFVVLVTDIALPRIPFLPGHVDVFLKVWIIGESPSQHYLHVCRQCDLCPGITYICFMCA